MSEGGLIWIRFRILEQNDMLAAVMWSKSKADVEFQYGGRMGEFHGMSAQNHLPHCTVLPKAVTRIFFGGCHVELECRRREDQGAVSAEEDGVWGGVSPSPENFCIF